MVNAQEAVAPVFEVKLEAPVTAPVSGRLIIIAIRPEDRFRPGSGGSYAGEALLQRRAEFLRMAQILGMSPSPTPTTSTIATGADVTLAAGQSIDIGAGAATIPRRPAIAPAAILSRPYSMWTVTTPSTTGPRPDSALREPPRIVRKTAAPATTPAS